MIQTMIDHENQQRLQIAAHMENDKIFPSVTLLFEQRKIIANKLLEYNDDEMGTLANIYNHINIEIKKALAIP